MNVNQKLFTYKFVNQKSNLLTRNPIGVMFTNQSRRFTPGGSRGAHPRGDSGGLMHEEEFEDASMNAEEEEAGVGTIKRRSLAYLEYKNSRNGGRNQVSIHLFVGFGGYSGRQHNSTWKRWLTWKTEFRWDTQECSGSVYSFFRHGEWYFPAVSQTKGRGKFKPTSLPTGSASKYDGCLFFCGVLVLLSLKYRNRITPQNIPHMITYNYLRLTTYRWDMAGGLLPWSQVMQAVKEMRKTLETEAVPSFLLYKWTSWTNIVKTVRATPLDLPSRNRTMWGLPIVPLGLYSNHHEY